MLNLIDTITLGDYIRKIECYDHATFLHSVRVNLLAMEIGKLLTLDQAELSDLFISAALHDYGKIFLPKELLLTTERYSAAQRRIAELHVELGCQYLKSSRLMTTASLCGIREHHERLDGSGYPRHISDISIIGRILGVVDVFDAMTHKRCYKGACSPRYSLNEIQKGGGILYDDEVVNVLAQLVEGEHPNFDFNNVDAFLADFCITGAVG